MEWIASKNSEAGNLAYAAYFLSEAKPLEGGSSLPPSVLTLFQRRGQATSLQGEVSGKTQRREAIL
jgi:hypothetical protein